VTGSILLFEGGRHLALKGLACVLEQRLSVLVGGRCLCDLVAGGATMAPNPDDEMENDPIEEFKALIQQGGSKPRSSLPSKFVKKQAEIPSLELSPEEPCNLALLLAEKALIGKFTGLWPNPKTVEAWMDDRWKSLIQGEVSLCAVGRGFFVFSFTKAKDRDLVFRSGPYFMGARGLFLAPWTLDFNPGDEITAVPVWVRLPHLPLHLWGRISLKDIDNKLGRFLDNMAPKEDQYTYARICVEVSLEEGLPEAIKLTLGEWSHIQELDYEQIPFKCLRCHAYGHFTKSCPKASEVPGPVKEDDFQPVANRRRPPRRKGPLPQAQKSTHSAEATLENKNSFDALKEDEAQDPETAVVKGNPPVGESPPDSTPPESVAARKDRASADEIPPDFTPPGPVAAKELRASGPVPSASAGLTDSVPSSNSVEASDSEDISVPSPPLTRGRKSNKAHREKEAASNISSGSQKMLDPFLNRKIPPPSG
jgi:hypothetical protein